MPHNPQPISGWFKLGIMMPLAVGRWVVLAWCWGWIAIIMASLIWDRTTTSDYITLLLQQQLALLPPHHPGTQWLQATLSQWQQNVTAGLNQLTALPLPFADYLPATAQPLWRQGLNASLPWLQQGATLAQLLWVRCVQFAGHLPLFALLGAVGLTDGLVCRALRRAGGGRESTLIFHRTRAWIGLSLKSALLISLLLPIALAPLWLMLPLALWFALSLRLAAQTLKKYL